MAVVLIISFVLIIYHLFYQAYKKVNDFADFFY